MNSRTGAEITLEDAPETKKSTSRAASAAERRREQNRIAQRNHRNKVRERQMSKNESNSETNETQASDVSMQQAFDNMMKDTDKVNSANLSSSASPWLGFQSVPQVPTSTFMVEQDFNQFPMQCSCNNVFGPCDFHRQQMKAQFSTFSFMNEVSPEFKPVDAMSNMLPGAAGDIFSQTTGLGISSPVPSFKHLGVQSTPPRHPMMDPIMPVTTADMQSHMPMPTSSYPEMAQSFSTPVDPVLLNNMTTSPTPNAPSQTTTDNNINMTACFEKLLFHVHECGFDSFDAAVSQYYTHNFDRLSVPDVAQKASRGRRLRRVLTQIDESSADWTLWEARGYREKVVEAAERIYTSEMERLAKQTQRRNRAGSIASAPARTGTPQSSRGRNPVHHRAMSLAAEDSSMDEEEDLHSIFGGNSTLGSIAMGNAASPFSFSDQLSQLGPASLQKIYQNKLPNLWALLTGLAGSQGSQADLAATAALSLFSSTAQNPEMKLDEFLEEWTRNLRVMGVDGANAAANAAMAAAVTVQQAQQNAVVQQQQAQQAQQHHAQQAQQQQNTQTQQVQQQQHVQPQQLSANGKFDRPMVGLGMRMESLRSDSGYGSSQSGSISSASGTTASGSGLSRETSHETAQAPNTFSNTTF